VTYCIEGQGFHVPGYLERNGSPFFLPGRKGTGEEWIFSLILEISGFWVVPPYMLVRGYDTDQGEIAERNRPPSMVLYRQVKNCQLGTSPGCLNGDVMKGKMNDVEL
jgi:hypothetical protein